MTVSPTDAWAAGGRLNVGGFIESPLVEHWDGIRWHVLSGVPSPPGWDIPSPAGWTGLTGLHALTVVPRDQVWVAGEEGLIEHWDGARWRFADSNGIAGAITAIVAGAPGELWAVSDRSEIDHYAAPACRPASPIVRTIGLALSPRAVAVDARTGRAFVGTSGGLVILDTRSGGIMQTAPWAASVSGVAAAQPGSLALDEATGRVFVAHAGLRGGAGAVGVFDATTGALVRMIPGINPSAVAVAGQSGLAFAVFAGAPGSPSSGSVAVLDALSGQVLRVTPVGMDPTAEVVDERSGYVCVANAGGGTVNILDARTGAWLRTISLGAHPTVLAVASARGRVVIGSREGDLRILDAVSGRLRRTIRLHMHTMVRIRALTTDDRAGLALVAWDDTKSGYVSILDARSGTLVRTIAVVGTPVALAGDWGRLVVASQGGAINGRRRRAGWVSILENGRSRRVIAVPGRPVALALDAPAQRIIVLSQGIDGARAGQVTVLRAD